MDASALASALDKLQASWSALDWWLDLWTILVVLGVAVELLVLAIEYLQETHAFRRGTIRSPENPSLVVYGLALAGTVLVTTGVAGEFWVHIEAGKIETQMRNTTRELAAVANREAAAARERAANAEERAANVERSDTQLRIELEKQKQRTAALNEQGPRWRLLRSRQAELVRALSTFADQRVRFYVSGPREPTDEEKMSTWAALNDVLFQAKWKVEQGDLIADTERRAVGIHVYVSTKASSRTVQAADALAAELAKMLPASDRSVLRQDPDVLDRMRSLGLLQSKDAPFMLAARDLTLVVVLIGTHPQQ